MLLVKYNISYNNICRVYFYMVLLEFILFVIIENMKGKIFLFERIIYSLKCLCIYCDDFKIC